MIISYTKLDPTKNITLLVDTPVPREQQSKIADMLLKSDCEAEQVGFLEPATNPNTQLRLQMAGGEFCGNASLSAAALTAKREGILMGEIRQIQLEVSGTNKPVPVRMFVGFDGVFCGTVAMPLPYSVAEEMLVFNEKTYVFPVVHFLGIDHVIVNHAPKKEMAEAAIKEWCKQFASEAMGIIFLDEDNMSITPLVYVAACDSLYWENSCASGSTAAAVWLAMRRGSGRYALKQPGGTLTVDVAVNNGIVRDLRLCGQVRILESKRIRF